LLKTKFTELTGCRVPIQQAGMGDIASPSLAAAVANAGALGMVSVTGISDEPPRVEKALQQARQLTKGVLGANFIIADAFLPDLSEIKESVQAASKIVRVIDFFYRKPEASLVNIVHDGGALVSWQVGSKEEAIAAEKAGCDVIIAQGIEAGGHVRGKTGILSLLDQVLDAVEVPVLAAGGIGTARSLAAVIAAGASGARIGTRFAAAQESGAHPEYVKALIESDAKDTVLTEAFSNGWPNAPHRVLRSSLEAAQAFQDDVVGERDPYWTGNRVKVHRFQPIAITKETTGNIGAMPHWAGESVGGVKKVQTGAEIVEELSAGAEKLLRSWPVEKNRP
jgi:nitronate monooxygenase